MMVYSLMVWIPKYLTKSLTLFSFLSLLHIVEEPVDIVMLLDEVLGKPSEPVEYSQAKYDDYNTHYINHVQ
jgi:hypothetical protein